MRDVVRLTRREIALRAAADLQAGWYVNLGVGIPNLIADLLIERDDLMVHSENGVLGLGPQPAPGHEHPDLVDSGKRPASVKAGAAFFDTATSFTMLRGGHVNAAVVGAYQVSANGDLANWIVPGARIAGIGGAADICVGVPRIFVTMFHTFSDGRPKLVKACTYPPTAFGVVRRVYTDLAVIDITNEGFLVREICEGATPDFVQERSAAELHWADDLAPIAIGRVPMDH